MNWLLALTLLTTNWPQGTKNAEKGAKIVGRVIKRGAKKVAKTGACVGKKVVHKDCQ